MSKLQIASLTLAGLLAILGGIAVWDHSHRPQPRPNPPESVSAASDTINSIDNTGWETYTNVEDGYSVQYPSLGDLAVKHDVPPAIATTLGWVGVSDYDIAISVFKPGTVFNPKSLSFREWLGWYAVQPPAAHDLILNGVTWAVDNEPATQGGGGLFTAYRQESTSLSSTIYEVRFGCYSDGPTCPPPFWQNILSTFRILP